MSLDAPADYSTQFGQICQCLLSNRDPHTVLSHTGQHVQASVSLAELDV